MIDDPVLIEDWHPVARVEDLAGGGPVAARLLGEDLVLWRSGDEYLAWRDLCVHRGTRLSLGHAVNGDRREREEGAPLHAAHRKSTPLHASHGPTSYAA